VPLALVNQIHHLAGTKDDAEWYSCRALSLRMIVKGDETRRF